MTDKDPKAAVRRRFMFIEFNLLWERSIGRRRLQEQFEISPQQATKDLSGYADACPGNMIYDTRLKTYVPSPRFRPQFIEGDASEYLLQLEMLILGYRERDEVWIDTVPTADAVRISSRPIKRDILRSVLDSIQSRRPIAARYVSLSSGAEAERHLQPHAMATDGHRWHMRAFDIDKERYSDFVLSRVETIRTLNHHHHPANAPRDEAWNTFVPVILTVDEELEERQRNRLEYEYNMINGELCLEVRQAMLFYYLRNYGFNPRPKSGRAITNLSSYRLKLKNIDEVTACLNRRSS